MCKWPFHALRHVTALILVFADQEPKFTLSTVHFAILVSLPHRPELPLHQTTQPSLRPHIPHPLDPGRSSWSFLRSHSCGIKKGTHLFFFNDSKFFPIL